jgi:phosphorylase kinase alpha/beta subunit
VENEYPIFFIFMAINNIFSNNLSEARVYYDLVTKLIRQTKTNAVIPYYYYVPKEFIELERSNPNTQERLPSNEIQNDSSHLWTQSVWIICQLLGIRV